MPIQNAFTIPERSSVLDDKELQRSARVARQQQAADRRLVMETGGRLGAFDRKAHQFGQRTGRPPSEK
ncbi:MAG: hypothetical protein EOP84_09685 [Verrucomicrobiaceae bacterium]|nr:MAG: hypothetical protein EOP84_09685 [Verrucomicrobiaceae bacterium]